MLLSNVIFNERDDKHIYKISQFVHGYASLDNTTGHTCENLMIK